MTAPNTAAPALSLAESKDKPTRILPTERVQFTKQLNLLRAYAAVSGQTNKDAKISDVAQVAKLNGSTVSLCNGFFVDVGFLERVANGGFTPSEEVQAYLRAFSWTPDVAAHKLAPRLRTTWFFERLQPKLAMGGVSEAEAVHDLADAASAGTRYAPQLELLLDYLEAAGLIRRDGGIIREGPTAGHQRGERQSAPPPPPVRNVTSSDAATGREAVVPPQPTVTAQGIRFSIDLNVDMAEISTWSADRITAFFAGVAKVMAAKQGGSSTGE